MSEQVYRQPVPAPGHLRRAGLSQSPPEQVPRQCLRQNRLAGLERHNATLVRPSSIRRCVASYQILCTKGAKNAELFWTVPSFRIMCRAKGSTHGPGWGGPYPVAKE